MKVRYGRTFNLGNYETHHIELELGNVNKDKYALVFKWLVAKVEELHKSTKAVKQTEKELVENIVNPDWLNPDKKS